jgi:DNA-directed RNA polymerase specialized sigma24 family protein
VEKANRLKRSPGQAILSLDDATADELYRTVPANTSSPDKIFEKRWALSVVEAVLSRLRSEFENAERAELFEALKPSLSADKLDKPYSEIATQFGVTEGNVKIAVHRLRKRFGELLRAEVAQTVEDESEIEAELRYLLQALAEP